MQSRGLPKPNYFPLLPPISPADAKRFCKITKSSIGLPSHHYIPVVLGYHRVASSKRKNSNASIKSKNEDNNAINGKTNGIVSGNGTKKPKLRRSYGKKKHVVLENYKYLIPILNGDREQQVTLRRLLETKPSSITVTNCNRNEKINGNDNGDICHESQERYVYAVEERRCSLVLPAELEAAVRDGDVQDVMLSKDSDAICLRLKKNQGLVSLDCQELSVIEDNGELYEGAGPREDVYREKIQRKKKTLKNNNENGKKLRTTKVSILDGVDQAKKIFEDKEKAEEVVELEIAEQIKSLRDERIKKKKQNIAKKLQQQQSILQTVESSTTETKINENGSENNNDKVISSISEDIIEETSHAEFDYIVQTENDEIMATERGERLVTGQIVDTESGPTFVPGQVIETPVGPRFVPGRVEDSSNGVVFIPSQIVETEEGLKFVAPDLADTPEGERFSVQGFKVSPEELKLLQPNEEQQQQQQSIDEHENSCADTSSIVTEATTIERLTAADVDPKVADFDCALITAEKIHGFQGNVAIQVAQLITIMAMLANKIINQKFQTFFADYAEDAEEDEDDEESRSSRGSRRSRRAAR